MGEREHERVLAELQAQGRKERARRRGTVLTILGFGVALAVLAVCGWGILHVDQAKIKEGFAPHAQTPREFYHLVGYMAALALDLVFTVYLTWRLKAHI
ncbi:MAG: hypothetical protein HY608_01725 [Planctomycetes bacterium]|nr:hypothetical protein [Planctomycetota bacterium]